MRYSLAGILRVALVVHEGTKGRASKQSARYKEAIYMEALFYILGIPLFLILVVGVGMGWNLRRWFLILLTPTKRIADLADIQEGRVGIEGHVRAIKTITHLDRSVVYYKVRKERLVILPFEYGGVWKKKSESRTLLPFEVTDGSGT
jgi:hypothetical protein